MSVNTNKYLNVFTKMLNERDVGYNVMIKAKNTSPSTLQTRHLSVVSKWL